MHSTVCKSWGQTLDPGGKVDGTLYMLLFGTENRDIRWLMDLMAEVWSNLDVTDMDVSSFGFIYLLC